MKPLSQDHKDLGVVYTPEILVEFICSTAIYTYISNHLKYKGMDYSISQLDNMEVEKLPREVLSVILNLIEEITVIDPAVGAGYFLENAFNVLFKIHQVLIRLGVQKKPLSQISSQIVTKNLFGVDISNKAVELCREKLKDLIITSESDFDGTKIEKLLKYHIKVGNSLIGNTLQRKDITISESIFPFNWEEEFPDIASSEGFAICVGNPPWNIVKPFEKEFFSRYDPHLSKYRYDKQEAKKIIEKLKSSKTIKKEWIKYESTIKDQSEYYRKAYQYQSGMIRSGSETRRVSGDLNLYKLFLERIYFLLAKNGVCGVILPSGIHSDAGTKDLRKIIFEENEVTNLFSFENRLGIFPSIHKSFKFDILIFLKNHVKTDQFQSVFMQRDPLFLKNHPNTLLSISWEKIKRFSPSAWAIIEFKNRTDIQIAEKMYQFPVIASSVSGFSDIIFSRELDITIDSHLFNMKGKGYPVVEGKMIEQFTHRYKSPRYWIDKQSLGNKFDESYSEHKQARIGFRAVAASTNRRTMIATLIPSNSCCSNSIIYVKNYSKFNQVQMKQDELLYLLGIFNSFVFDYMIRMKVSQNLNMFILRDMPLPRFIDRQNEREIISLVKEVYRKYPEWKDEISSPKELSSEKSMIEIRAHLDARVAYTYALTYNELEYILDQFHVRDAGKESELDKNKKIVLTYFKNLQD